MTSALHTPNGTEPRPLLGPLHAEPKSPLLPTLSALRPALPPPLITCVLAVLLRQDSDVYFELKTKGKRGEVREVGAGFLNLRKAHKAGEDHVQVGVELNGSVGVAGTLTVTILAVDVMKAVLAPPPRGGGRQEQVAGRGRAQPTAGGAARLPTDTIKVDISSLSLPPNLRNDPNIAEVFVEIDLVDIGDKAALTTTRIRKTSSPLDFRYSHALTIKPGSKEQKALRAVLDHAVEEVSDV